MSTGVSSRFITTAVTAPTFSSIPVSSGFVATDSQGGSTTFFASTSSSFFFDSSSFATPTPIPVTTSLFFESSLSPTQIPTSSFITFTSSTTPPSVSTVTITASAATIAESSSESFISFATSTATGTASSQTHLNVALIAGVIVGVLVLITLIVLAILRFRDKNRKSPTQQPLSGAERGAWHSLQDEDAHMPMQTQELDTGSGLYSPSATIMSGTQPGYGATKHISEILPVGYAGHRPAQPSMGSISVSSRTVRDRDSIMSGSTVVSSGRPQPSPYVASQPAKQEVRTLQSLREDQQHAGPYDAQPLHSTPSHAPIHPPPSYISGPQTRTTMRILGQRHQPALSTTTFESEATHRLQRRFSAGRESTRAASSSSLMDPFIDEHRHSTSTYSDSHSFDTHSSSDYPRTSISSRTESQDPFSDSGHTYTSDDRDSRLRI